MRWNESPPAFDHTEAKTFVNTLNLGARGEHAETRPGSEAVDEGSRRHRRAVAPSASTGHRSHGEDTHGVAGHDRHRASDGHALHPAEVPFDPLEREVRAIQ